MLGVKVENKNFTVREKCIFCSSDLTNHLFEQDLENYVAHYAVEKLCDKFDLIPYNVLSCDKCGALQTKYLGDLNEIYKINHADGTGITMQKMHEKKLDLILKYQKNVNGIIEIGSSIGMLSDLILKNIDTNYYVIEPSYFGNTEKRIIISDFYENVNDEDLDANTLIMSHVFEHFYNPLEILEKIKNNNKIENIFLTFPNLEKYISEGIHHVLNTEHTFYVDNNFIEQVFKLYGFELIENDIYKTHSVFFYFKRNEKIKTQDVILKNEKSDISNYFQKIKETVDHFNRIIKCNPQKNIYLFPASCHSIFLSVFGLNYKSLTGMVDNSPNKIGKKVYGLELEIFSFKETLKNNKDSIFLINGGIFNSEIEQQLIQNNVEYHTFKID